jgi:hypothetical protein
MAEKEFHGRVIAIMQSLQQLKNKAQGFFHHPITNSPNYQMIYVPVNRINLK